MTTSQAERTAANRKARIERELKRAGVLRRRGKKIPRGTMRGLLRARWAEARTKVSVKVPGWGTDKRGMPIQIEITKEVWKPTFAEWRKQNVKED